MRGARASDSLSTHSARREDAHETLSGTRYVGCYGDAVCMNKLTAIHTSKRPSAGRLRSLQTSPDHPTNESTDGARVNVSCCGSLEINNEKGYLFLRQGGP